VTGETPKKEREAMLSDFKAGRIQAMTNANVLTTGFDHPDIDLIAMLRPTMSPGLYVQMAGRGMRPSTGKTDCLVLDFAGVVATHGPITAVQPPRKGGKGEGDAPVKVCDQCGELVHPTIRICPACGFEFPKPPEVKLELRNDDIMGLEATEMIVTGWQWREHTSRASGKKMLAVTYYGSLSDPAITEYLPILHDGYAGQRAMQQLANIARAAGAVLADVNKLAEYQTDFPEALQIASNIMTEATPPSVIGYKLDGKYHRVLERSWKQ
jgi:DNA repair protein RadD